MCVTLEFLLSIVDVGYLGILSRPPFRQQIKIVTRETMRFSRSDRDARALISKHAERNALKLVTSCKMSDAITNSF